MGGKWGGAEVTIALETQPPHVLASRDELALVEGAQHWQAQGFGLIQAFSTSTLLKFWTREFFALGLGGRHPVYCKMLAASLASTKCQECPSSCDTQNVKLPLIENHWFSLITAEPK